MRPESAQQGNVEPDGNAHQNVQQQQQLVGFSMMAVIAGVSVIVVVGLVVGLSVGLTVGRNDAASPPPTLSPPQGPPVTASPNPTVPSLSHVVLVLEENQRLTNVIGSSSAPYINGLASAYGLATNYFALTHPSLPNYIALTAGTTAGISSDCSPGPSCMASVTNLADNVEAATMTWKIYAESMPSACYAADSGAYLVRHNPFVYFSDVAGNASRCDSHVVPFTQLATDIANNALPNFTFITPNQYDDMHSASVAAGDSWLSQNAPTILQSAAFQSDRALMIIVWDESDATASNNNVPCIFVGARVTRGYRSVASYTHYSLTHTIETALGLATLTTNDASAATMADMFNASFDPASPP